MTEYPSSVPYATVSTVFDAKDFVNKTGSRYFIPICPLAKPNFSFLTSSTRSLDINLEAGYSELDSIIINIPPSYLPESLPKDINITTPFGTFSTTIKHEGNSIIYTEYIDIYSGKYPKEQYKDLKEFFSKISAAIKRKVTIKRQD